jgi:hypothetical protein
MLKKAKSMGTIILDGNETEFLVEPVDIVFVAKGHQHIVESITPRASLIFTAEDRY